MTSFIKNISWPVILVLTLTIGLAPYTPQPHLVSKLIMLFSGQLQQPLDWFDLIMHASPFALIVIKLISIAKQRDNS